MPWCPECGREYPAEIVACVDCRVPLADEPPPPAGEVVVAHRVPDVASGALLCGVLVAAGIPATVRSARLPAYGDVGRDWSTTAWGEILVPSEALPEAREVLADYLAALAQGGEVRDEDVENAAD